MLDITYQNLEAYSIYSPESASDRRSKPNSGLRLLHDMDLVGY